MQSRRKVVGETSGYNLMLAYERPEKIGLDCL